MQLLETDRLLLRPFTLDDAEGLYAYASHPEVGPPAGWPPHRSVEESRQVIENIFIPSDALAVLRKSDGRLIGSAGFVDRHRAELGTPSEEIGYSLARDCWGQGLIPEAVKEIIRHAFADLGYQALWAAYYDGNRKSKRVMQKCGMTYRLSRIEAVEQLGETRLAHYFAVTVWPVESEEEARARIEEIRKKHYDARHHCWCYRIREGGVERYSDDGEPQGTAGQPMLNVFQREGVTNVCCVVTRYFGGILLGAGGLVRAYTQSAKDALDAAGISVVRRWVEVAVPCPYSFFERLKLELEAHGGVLGEVEYAADVTVHALLPEERAEAFSARLTELAAGGVAAQVCGESFQAVPRT